MFGGFRCFFLLEELSSYLWRHCDRNDDAGVPMTINGVGWLTAYILITIMIGIFSAVPGEEVGRRNRSWPHLTPNERFWRGEKSDQTSTMIHGATLRRMTTPHAPTAMNNAGQSVAFSLLFDERRLQTLDDSWLDRENERRAPAEGEGRMDGDIGAPGALGRPFRRLSWRLGTDGGVHECRNEARTKQRLFFPSAGMRLLRDLDGALDAGSRTEGWLTPILALRFARRARVIQRRREMLMAFNDGGRLAQFFERRNDAENVHFATSLREKQRRQSWSAP